MEQIEIKTLNELLDFFIELGEDYNIEKMEYDPYENNFIIPRIVE